MDLVETGIPGYVEAASERTIRLDVPDAAVGGLHTINVAEGMVVKQPANTAIIFRSAAVHFSS